MICGRNTFKLRPDRNTKHLCNMFTSVDICQTIAQAVVQKKIYILA